jgi:signal transduction histidine kinase
LSTVFAKLQTFAEKLSTKHVPELFKRTRVGWPVLGLIALIAAAGFYLLGDIASNQDATYEKNTRGFVQQSVDALILSNAKISSEYSTWDDAYENITLTDNPSWVRSNFYSTNTSSVAVVRPEVGLRFIYVGPEFESKRAILSRFVAGLDLVKQEKSRTKSAQPYAKAFPNGLMSIDGQLAAVAVQPLRPEPGSDVKLRDQRLPIDYVVIVTFVDAGFLEGVARSFALDRLKLTMANGEHHSDGSKVSVTIKGDDGGPLAHVEWKNERPGSAAFTERVVPISIALAFVGFLTMLVTQQIVTGQMRLVELARTAAEEGSRAKSDFLANVSHELRTPLNAIIGFAEIIDEECTMAGNDLTARDAKKVSSSAQHLLGLINDLLDHSKIEAGKMDMSPADIELALLVSSISDELAGHAAKNGNTIVVNCDPLIGEAHIDGMRLKQCLLNLASNASKFTKGGKVTLSARPVDREGVPFILMTVKDTGIGMSPATLAKLFVPFVQASETTAKNYGGTGLGLVITRRLAEAMGGSVSVESVEGQGSTFTLLVPRGMAWPQAAQSDTDPIAVAA